MIDYWRRKHRDPSQFQKSFVLPDTRTDLLRFSLNVICSAGFGVKLPFEPAAQAGEGINENLFQDSIRPQGFEFTFREVMEYMSHSVFSVFIANNLVPSWIPRSLVPFFSKGFAAYKDLEKYLQAMVRDAETRQGETGNLLDSLVRARQQEQATNKHSTGLTDSEVLGNVYMFTLAGHETTATTLRFALVLLALHTDVQEELHAELRTIFQESPDPAAWDFGVYPNLLMPVFIMVGIFHIK